MASPGPRIKLDKEFMTTIEEDGKMRSGWRLASSCDESQYVVFASGQKRTWYGMPVITYKLLMVYPDYEVLYEGRKKDILYLLDVLLADTIL